MINNITTLRIIFFGEPILANHVMASPRKGQLEENMVNIKSLLCSDCEIFQA